VKKVEEKNGIVTFKKEVKGLEQVRRDWCPLSSQMGEYVTRIFNEFSSNMYKVHFGPDPFWKDT
jgi:DNA polymerase elongation subunit (family B)